MDATRPGSDMARILSGLRKAHTRWRRSTLDEAADVGGTARVEEHVALAHGRLLGPQPGGEQRLADLDRERAVVAGEAARQVREVGVVAAPLAHAVEPLEDAARDAAPRDRVLVRAHRRRAGLQHGKHAVLELLDSGGILGAAAE